MFELFDLEYVETIEVPVPYTGMVDRKFILRPAWTGTIERQVAHAGLHQMHVGADFLTRAAWYPKGPYWDGASGRLWARHSSGGGGVVGWEIYVGNKKVGEPSFGPPRVTNVEKTYVQVKDIQFASLPVAELYNGWIVCRINGMPACHGWNGKTPWGFLVLLLDTVISLVEVIYSPGDVESFFLDAGKSLRFNGRGTYPRQDRHWTSGHLPSNDVGRACLAYNGAGHIIDLSNGEVRLRGGGLGSSVGNSNTASLPGATKNKCVCCVMGGGRWAGNKGPPDYEPIDPPTVAYIRVGLGYRKLKPGGRDGWTLERTGPAGLVAVPIDSYSSFLGDWFAVFAINVEWDFEDPMAYGWDNDTVPSWHMYVEDNPNLRFFESGISEGIERHYSPAILPYPLPMADTILPGIAFVCDPILPGWWITYNGNIETGGTVPPRTYKEPGVPATVSANTGALVKTGYTYDGWNTNASGTGTDYAEGSSYTDEADITLYAKWIPGEYEVTYDGNSQDSGTAPADQTKLHDTPLLLSGNTGALVKAGYAFHGWNTAADGSGDGYDLVFSQYYYNNADVTLYAWWLPTFTVTYDGNGNDGGSPPADQEKIQDVPLALAGDPGLTKTGYTLRGWNTSPDGYGVPYYFGSYYYDNAPITLYAWWEPD
jgi:uncharacterized repeat protein (TIGR02543 family)